ncbi:hypothetical protein [Nostoc sp. CCY0012]|uniref:hypothetical protein n=1 Tax=Nostoc sp. CCY0012 TaxID=1056123 RepID=UPI0039C64ABF
MEQNQHKPRQAADQEFQKSLEQLEDILQENLDEDQGTPPVRNESKNEVELVEDLTVIDLAALEDAVADIEEYLDKKTK